jgi:hypothetical protein
MIKLHPSYLVDVQERRKAVVLPIEEWTQILEALEELDDIRTYDKAKARQEQSVPIGSIRQKRTHPKNSNPARGVAVVPDRAADCLTERGIVC